MSIWAQAQMQLTRRARMGAGHAKRKITTAILACVLWGDAPGLDYLGRAQHTTHKSEEPNKEERTIQSFVSINACMHSPSPGARDAIDLRSQCGGCMVVNCGG